MTLSEAYLTSSSKDWHPAVMSRQITSTVMLYKTCHEPGTVILLFSSQASELFKIQAIAINPLLNIVLTETSGIFRSYPKPSQSGPTPTRNTLPHTNKAQKHTWPTQAVHCKRRSENQNQMSSLLPGWFHAPCYCEGFATGASNSVSTDLISPIPCFFHVIGRNTWKYLSMLTLYS